MKNETRRFIGGVVGVMVGIALTFTIFKDHDGWYWWIGPPFLLGKLGMILAKKDKK